MLYALAAEMAQMRFGAGSGSIPCVGGPNKVGKVPLSLQFESHQVGSKGRLA